MGAGIWPVRGWGDLPALGASRHAGTIGFLGSFPQTIDQAQGLLAKAVQHKIEKHYPESSRSSLWLLAYTNAGDALVDARAIALAKAGLANARHHFDEAWYILPYPDEDMGAIEHLWP
jgi:hypothetical protein